MTSGQAELRRRRLQRSTSQQLIKCPPDGRRRLPQPREEARGIISNLKQMQIQRLRATSGPISLRSISTIAFRSLVSREFQFVIVFAAAPCFLFVFMFAAPEMSANSICNWTTLIIIMHSGFSTRAVESRALTARTKPGGRCLLARPLARPPDN